MSCEHKEKTSDGHCVWCSTLSATPAPSPGFSTSTGALKNDTGKVMLSLLDPLALLEVARVLTQAANGEYSAHNWRKGMAWSRLCDSTLGHLLAFINGQDRDYKSGLYELAHVICGSMFLLNYQITNSGTDDRHKSDVPFKR